MPSKIQISKLLKMSSLFKFGNKADLKAKLSTSNFKKHICIIGNGIAGITAARHIRKYSDYQITVISSESKYFYSRTALMYIYMGQMKFAHTMPYEDWFWAKNRIDLVCDSVINVNFDKKEIILNTSTPISYDKLIIATGSKYNTFNWPGQSLEGVSGLYSIQDLEKIERFTKNIKVATIVGGGLIGIELAEMLLSRNIEVNFMVRENHFWSNVLPKNEGKLIEKEISKHKVNLLLNNELAEILGGENNAVKAVKTISGDIFESQFVGLTVGVSPNISFLQNTALHTNKGVYVNEYLETNLPNVYAIGDCAEHLNPTDGRKPVEQIWYSGKKMGETVAKTIGGNKTKYEPGIYYNSAKFFDLEYSVYGEISAESHNFSQENHLIENINTFYWENNQADKCFRINYQAKTGAIIGIHTIGIRLRANICLTWIENKININTVISELEMANFEPEFSRKYLKDIKQSISNI